MDLILIGLVALIIVGILILCACAPTLRDTLLALPPPPHPVNRDDDDRIRVLFRGRVEIKTATDENAGRLVTRVHVWADTQAPDPVQPPSIWNIATPAEVPAGRAGHDPPG